MQSKFSKTTAILYKCSQIIESYALCEFSFVLISTVYTLFFEIWANTYRSNINRIVIIQKIGYYLAQANLIILLLFSREQMY